MEKRLLRHILRETHISHEYLSTKYVCISKMYKITVITVKCQDCN